MNIAFSPCPNDTFIFHAWVHGQVAGAPTLNVTYADIDITNTLAEGSDGPDVLKVSYASLPWIDKSYGLLPCGGALGRGCGPLLLAKDSTSLAGKTVAVPSERSTAYLLFRLWLAQHVPTGVKEIRIMPFSTIMPAIRDGLVDAGLVIHEARFTYPSYDLTCLVDLGDWWEQNTSLPIPLGAIIAKKTLDHTQLSEWTRASLAYAWQHPTASRDYVMKHAQEMDWHVAQEHISLYVNSFSQNLGEEGYLAIETLFERAIAEKLVPAIDLPSLLMK